MPNGHTEPIFSGKEYSFKDFAFSVARGFSMEFYQGAQGEFRAIPWSESQYNSRYYLDALDKDIEKLRELLTLSDEEKADRFANAVIDGSRELSKKQEESDAMRVRYQEMLDRVRAWEPPNDDFLNLKADMVRHLEESMDFDCIDYTQPSYRIFHVPEAADAEEYWRGEVNSCLRAIGQHRDGVDRSFNNWAKQYDWSKKLVESVEKYES